MVRVMLVDGAPVFRYGFRKEVEECDDIVLMAEIPTVAKAIEVLQVGALPHVVVTDVKFKEESVLPLLKHIRNLKSSCRVLVLAEAPEEECGDVVRRAGAHGYVTKDSSPEEILGAIRRVGNGEFFFSEVPLSAGNSKMLSQLTKYMGPLAADQGLRFCQDCHFV